MCLGLTSYFVHLSPSHHHERRSGYSATGAIETQSQGFKEPIPIYTESQFFAPLPYGANAVGHKTAQVTITNAPFPRTRRMTNIPLTSVGEAHREAFNQAKLDSALREHLRSALLVLNALDQSSLASLATDEEYKVLVHQFFSPLDTPLSSIAGQFNRGLRRGLDAIPAQVVNTSQGATLVVPLPTTSSPCSRFLSPLALLQGDATKAASTMMTIHFLAGHPKPGMAMQKVVDCFNACIKLHLSLYRDSFPDAPAPVAEARTTRSGDRIVLGLSLGKFAPRVFAEVVQNVDLSSFGSSDAVTHIRRGGIVDFIIRICKLSEDVANTHSAELIRQVEEFLASYCGGAIKMTKKISPFIYLCEGRKSVLDQFFPAFKEGIDFIIGSLPGQRRIFPGVIIEGFALSDSFDFV